MLHPVLAPLAAPAHAGHGTTAPDSWLHHLVEGPHAAPWWLACAVLAIGLLVLARRSPAASRRPTGAGRPSRAQAPKSSSVGR